MVSHGILAALLSCQGNWQASLALMDKAVLARPPLLVASTLSLSFSSHEFAAPGQPPHLESRVLALNDAAEPYTVDVAVSCRSRPVAGEASVEFASGTARFTKIGAARSLGS